MTLAEIKDYQNNIDKKITLFGYISCSLKKNTAMSFMWENTERGHQKILLHIIWNSKYAHYYLNAGAYDHEEEQRRVTTSCRVELQIEIGFHSHQLHRHRHVECIIRQACNFRMINALPLCLRQILRWYIKHVFCRIDWKSGRGGS